MTEVFDGYESQFCERFANLSQKCMSARVFLEEHKIEKISEIADDIDEVEALIHKMDLAARNMPSSMKAMLRAKTREYRNDLKKLKTELTRLDSSKADQATRDELLGSGGSDAIQLRGMRNNAGRSKKNCVVCRRG